MKKTFLKQLAPHIELHRDEKTGIAWVEDGTSGCGHSAHPNIDASGSVRGMKSRGFWRESDRTVRSHGFIYNIDSLVVSDKWDEVARQHCRCGGNHNTGNEFDMHVWCKPETGNMEALYTVSIGQQPICVDLPIDNALEYIRETLEERAN